MLTLISHFSADRLQLSFLPPLLVSLFFMILSPLKDCRKGFFRTTKKRGKKDVLYAAQVPTKAQMLLTEIHLSSARFIVTYSDSYSKSKEQKLMSFKATVLLATDYQSTLEHFQRTEPCSHNRAMV